MINIEELFYLNRLLDNSIIPGFEVSYLFNRNKSEEEIRKDLIDKDIIISKDDMNFKAFMLIGKLKQFKEANEFVWINDKPYANNKKSHILSIHKIEDNKIKFEKLTRVDLVNKIIKEFEFVSKMTKKSENTISIEEFNKYFEIDTNINNLRNRKDLLILKKEIDGHVQVQNCYFVYEDKKVYKYDLLKREIIPFNALDVVNDLVKMLYNLKV